MGNISKNFNRVEFACQCGCGFDTVDAETLKYLENIREHFNKPLRITSAARCHDHNKSVGGADKSMHKAGRACDIQIDLTAPSDIADYAESLGLSVGRYKTFTHIDTRTGLAARW